MKRFKLLSSLTMLGTLVPTVSLCITSCSNNDKNVFSDVYWFDGTKIQDWVMEINDSQEFRACDFCAWYDNEIVDIVSFQMTSSNPDVIEVQTLQENLRYNAIAKTQGKATLTFNIADENNHKQTISVTDTVVTQGTKDSIQLEAVNSSDFTWEQSTNTLTFSRNDIVRITLGTLKCDTNVKYNLDIYSTFCGVEINDNNDLTMRVEEAYDVGLKRIYIYPDGGVANQLDINIVYA